MIGLKDKRSVNLNFYKRAYQKRAEFSNLEEVKET